MSHMNWQASRHEDREPSSETTAHFRLVQMHRQRPRNAYHLFSPIRIHLPDSPGFKRMRPTAGFSRLIKPTVNSPMLLIGYRRLTASQAKIKRRNSNIYGRMRQEGVRVDEANPRSIFCAGSGKY